MKVKWKKNDQKSRKRREDEGEEENVEGIVAVMLCKY